MTPRGREINKTPPIRVIPSPSEPSPNASSPTSPTAATPTLAASQAEALNRLTRAHRPKEQHP